MVYKITGVPQGELPPDVEGDYDNAKSAKCHLDHLRKRFPEIDLVILKDGLKLTDIELDADVKPYEIQTEREEACRLPSTYRHGWGGERDDVAIGTDGTPAKVWRPDNPEDEYK